MTCSNTKVQDRVQRFYGESQLSRPWDHLQKMGGLRCGLCCFMYPQSPAGEMNCEFKKCIKRQNTAQRFVTLPDRTVQLLKGISAATVSTNFLDILKTRVTFTFEHKITESK